MAATVSILQIVAAAVVTVLFVWPFVWAARLERRRHVRWMTVHEARTARSGEDFYWAVFRALEALRARQIRVDRLTASVVADEIIAEAGEAVPARLLKAVS